MFRLKWSAQYYYDSLITNIWDMLRDKNDILESKIPIENLIKQEIRTNIFFKYFHWQEERHDKLLSSKYIFCLWLEAEPTLFTQ